ncbi:uncharacterized protein TRIADDRAFT_61167 [Trichoplax adhaerens]|uniref:Uncharacterized protein n=1 Tax=Trichoplax adhaerens TaxID=10228 RepID=B3SA81_TRIAD|nr:predicted protein [Trichoplax adhaerens]EDV20391.1 predicted protein [Trichoplax adhaerens]|eukprot:XP_002117085.1 predicted protein [Trichoplax adhaerens]
MEYDYEFDAPQWADLNDWKEEDDLDTSEWFSIAHPSHEKPQSPESKNNKSKKGKRRSIYCHSPISRLVLKQKQKMNRFTVTNRMEKNQRLLTEIASEQSCQAATLKSNSILTDKLLQQQDHVTTTDNMEKPVHPVLSDSTTPRRSPFLAKKLNSLEIDASSTNSPPARVVKPSLTFKKSDTQGNSPLTAKQASIYKKESRRSTRFNIFSTCKSSPLSSVRMSNCEKASVPTMALRSKCVSTKGNVKNADLRSSIKKTSISKSTDKPSKSISTKPRRSVTIENDPDLIKLIRKHNAKVAATKYKYDINGRRL